LPFKDFCWFIKLPTSFCRKLPSSSLIYGLTLWRTQILSPKDKRIAQKKDLKRLVYTASERWSISDPGKLLNICYSRTRREISQNISKYPQLMPIAKEIFGLRLVQDLLAFQKDLNNRPYVYLAHMPGIYEGINDPRETEGRLAKKDPNHGGLLSSRIFASVEIILIIVACSELLRMGCIPISIESDGFLVLARKDAPLDYIDK
jgi:hypothetical protein